jgi:hypothetical protein
MAYESAYVTVVVDAMLMADCPTTIMDASCMSASYCPS